MSVWGTTLPSSSYLTIFAVPSSPMTLPGIHLRPHFTDSLVPIPIQLVAWAGNIVSCCLPLLPAGCATGRTVMPHVFRPCHSVCPHAYFTSTPGVPLSVGHVSLVTLPCHQRPVTFASFSPSGCAHSALTIVPTLGTHEYFREPVCTAGTMSCILVGLRSCSMPLVPSAYLAFFSIGRASFLTRSVAPSRS